MLTLHHLNNSRSQRVIWLLEELNLPYQIIHYQRNPLTQLAPDELKQVHPLGKSPVITAGKQVLAESGAIIDTLLRQHPESGMIPEAGTQDYDSYTFWLHYAEGSLMPYLFTRLIFTRLPKQPMPFFVRPVARSLAGKVLSKLIEPNVSRNLHFVESYLVSHEWFAGDRITGADIQMSFPLEAVMSVKEMNDKFPAIGEFVKRIHARPAYRRALEKGGPYNYAS